MKCESSSPPLWDRKLSVSQQGAADASQDNISMARAFPTGAELTAPKQPSQAELAPLPLTQVLGLSSLEHLPGFLLVSMLTYAV